MRTSIILTIAAMLMLTGCSPTWTNNSVTPIASAKPPAVRPPTDPARIQLLEGDVTDRPYESLADISVVVNKTTIADKDPTREQVADELKREAAKIGADAVILVRYGTVGIGLLSWGSLDGRGRAIAFRQ